MKIVTIKRPFFIVVFLFILSIFITIIATSHLVQTSKVNIDAEDEFNIDIPDPDVNTCDDTMTNERHELLIQKYKEKKLVALTFDDGPSKYTEHLVDELEKRNVHATFFVLGENAEKRSDILKFSYDTGNEIGIHSYVHKLFTKLSEDEIIEQIDKTKNAISITTGMQPTLIRVPYGTINKKVTSVLEKCEVSNVLWTVDSLDWKFKNTKKTYNYIMKKFKGNDIILMHDSFKTSVETAILVIDKLQSECYTFVTVSEFLQIQKEMEN